MENLAIFMGRSLVPFEFQGATCHFLCPPSQGFSGRPVPTRGFEICLSLPTFCRTSIDPAFIRRFFYQRRALPRHDPLHVRSVLSAAPAQVRAPTFPLLFFRFWIGPSVYPENLSFWLIAFPTLEHNTTVPPGPASDHPAGFVGGLEPF